MQLPNAYYSVSLLEPSLLRDTSPFMITLVLTADTRYSMRLLQALQPDTYQLKVKDC